MLNYFYFHVCSLFSPLSVGKINMFTLCAVWMGKIFNFSSSISPFPLSFAFFSYGCREIFPQFFLLPSRYSQSRRTYPPQPPDLMHKQALETFFSEAFLMNSQNLAATAWNFHNDRNISLDFPSVFLFIRFFVARANREILSSSHLQIFVADGQNLSIALSRAGRTESSFVSRILVTLIVNGPQNQLDAIFSLHCPQFFHISLTYLLCWFSPKVAKSIRVHCFC